MPILLSLTETKRVYKARKSTITVRFYYRVVQSEIIRVNHIRGKSEKNINIAYLHSKNDILCFEIIGLKIY
jgi:hypothetical protein